MLKMKWHMHWKRQSLRINRGFIGVDILLITSTQMSPVNGEKWFNSCLGAEHKLLPTAPWTCIFSKQVLGHSKLVVCYKGHNLLPVKKRKHSWGQQIKELKTPWASPLLLCLLSISCCNNVQLCPGGKGHNSSFFIWHFKLYHPKGLRIVIKGKTKQSTSKKGFDFHEN